MGNVIGSLFSGFSQVLGQLLGHPLDFLSGKSCNSACGPTWDFVCYIENFCISNLLKLVMVATLVYFVLLFFYLLYKLGICQCICHTWFRIIWACFATCFSALDFCCTYVCFKLRSVKRKHRGRRRDIELAVISSSTSEEDYELGEDFSFQQPKNVENTRLRSKRKNYKEEHMKKSLRPNTHRAHVGIAGNSIHMHRTRRKSLSNGDDHITPLHHHIRVTRSSRFAQKGNRHRSVIHHRKR